ncbi:MAG TPA: hypothetical protein VL913_00715 [Candidatus Micrarchaeaceae archaeon]|nr:hypothetical protein [Candidatus Micrarchaeaceae archaeon]
MANDPNNKFEKKKKATATSDVREMSIGQRLTKYHNENSVGRNRFGDPIGETSETRHCAEQQSEIQSPWEKANLTPKAVTIGAGGTKLTPELQNLRQQIADEKDAAKTKRVSDAYLQGVASAVDRETSAAIFQAFLAKHENELLPSAFNSDNIMRGWEYAMEQRMPQISGMNIASLEVVYFWLRDNGFIEPKFQHQGQKAAKRWERPVVAQSAPTVRPRTAIVPNIREADIGKADAKTMDFEELQRAVKKTYRQSETVVYGG